MIYTWTKMTSVSYEYYWLDWVFRMDTYGPLNFPLFSFMRQCQYSFLMLVLCIVFLQRYGFIVWKKY